MVFRKIDMQSASSVRTLTNYNSVRSAYAGHQIPEHFQPGSCQQQANVFSMSDKGESGKIASRHFHQYLCCLCFRFRIQIGMHCLEARMPKDEASAR